MNVVALLIEPVWNWNAVNSVVSAPVQIAFNRTSVELKLDVGVGDLSKHLAFNRTSVELKRILSSFLSMRTWTFNRTSVELKHRISGRSAKRWLPLLIEPVWNWNSFVSLRLSRRRSLLIEPVWNWNLQGNHVPWRHLPPFNRTSVELKLRSARRSRCGVWLLIEPVWNWNERRPCLVFGWWHFF